MTKLWIIIIVILVGLILSANAKRTFRNSDDSVIIETPLVLQSDTTDEDRNAFLEWIQSIFQLKPTTQVPPLGDPITDCKKCECGIPNKKRRIVGGTESEMNFYPWMTLLTYRNSFYCGGSLISTHYVLSAAHCLDGFDSKLINCKFMKHDIKNEMHVLYTRIHEKYNNRNYNNDIGLLKIASPVEFSSELRPVCLPERDNNFSNLDAIVTGWGAIKENGGLADKLQEVVVPIWQQSECQKSGYGSSKITPNMMCAGFKEGGKDSCQGDSGGPLHINVNHIFKQVGIVSWGQGCARKNFPGVYTRVNRYYSWIYNNTIDGCLCQEL